MPQAVKLNLLHLRRHHIQPQTVGLKLLDLLKSMSHNLNPKLKQEVDLSFINLLKSLWYKTLYQSFNLKLKPKVDLRSPALHQKLSVIVQDLKTLMMRYSKTKSGHHTNKREYFKQKIHPREREASNETCE